MAFEILSPTYFGSLIHCRFKPKGPWLNSLLSLLLSFQVFFFFFRSLAFCNSLSARSRLTLQCVSGPLVPLHFPWCVYSQFILYRIKKGLIAQPVLETFLYNIKGLTNIPGGDALPIPLSSRVLPCCCFSPSLYPSQISASKIKWRDWERWECMANWHLNPTFLPKQDHWWITIIRR